MTSKRRTQCHRGATSTSTMNRERIPGFKLFRYHMLDWKLYAIALFLIIPSYMITLDTQTISFNLLHGILLLISVYHLESYRNFNLVRYYVNMLESDETLYDKFITTTTNRPASARKVRINKAIQERIKLISQTTNNSNDRQELPRKEESIRRNELENRIFHFDGFKWINKLIIFFWPKLSQYIHFRLDEFFRKEIRSGGMARSNKRSLRMLHSIIDQFSSHVLAIERFELGHQTPTIRKIHVRDYLGIAPVDKSIIEQREDQSVSSSVKVGKLIEIDLDLEYIGDMNLELLYRNCCCIKSRLGLKDIFMILKARLTIGPIKRDVPFIEQISLSFYQLPDYGYKGIALVELAELKMARKIINNTIKEHLLAPYAIIITAHDVIKAIGDKHHLKKKKLKKLSSYSSKELIENSHKKIIFNLKDEPIVARSDQQHHSHKRNHPHQHIHPDPEVLIKQHQEALKTIDPKELHRTSIINQSGSDRGQVSWFNRIGAQSFLYGCFCVNCCLKLCQRKTHRPNSQTNQGDEESTTRTVTAQVRDYQLSSRGKALGNDTKNTSNKN